MLKCCFFKCSLALDTFTFCADLGRKLELIPSGKQDCSFPSSASKPEIKAVLLWQLTSEKFFFFFSKFSFHAHSKTRSEEAYQNKIIRKLNQAFYSPFPSTKPTVCPVMSRSSQMGPRLCLTAWLSWLEEVALDCSLNGVRESPSVLLNQKGQLTIPL